MENDYMIPASLFEGLSELFDDCVCGHRPVISVVVTSSGCLMFNVWCSSCERLLAFSPSVFDGNMDFAALAVRWNNPEVFREVVL